MTCDKNCRCIVTGGVAFGAGISRIASQNGFMAGVEVATQGLKGVVSQALPGIARGMSFESLPKTRLEPSRVRVILEAPDVKQPTGVVVQSGYVVLRCTGQETGLAVIPGLKRLQAPDGDNIFREDTSQWWVLHINSGRTLSLRGYSKPEEAQVLAGLLARQDWTNDNTDLTKEDIQKARQTAEWFNQIQGYEN